MQFAPGTRPSRLVVVVALAGLIALSTASGAGASQSPGVLDRVQEAISAGRFAEAAGLATDLLSADSSLVGAYLMRARARYRLGEESAAAEDLERYLIAGHEDASAGPPERLPPGLPPDFVAWASRTSIEILGAVEAPALPEVSLEDLELESEILEISSHFVLDIEIVRIPVIVEGESGVFMSDLEAGTFRVVEGGGLPQRVDEMISESAPTSVGILVDASAAVGERAAEVRQVLVQLIQSLKAEDEVFLLQLAAQAEFLSAFSTDRLVLTAAADRYTVGEGRALYDGIAMGLIQMRSARYDKKALIVVAAGDDTSSSTEAAVVQLAAQREAVSIHGVVLESGVPRWRPSAEPAQDAQRTEAAAPAEFLQRLVHNTGGLVALRPPNVERYGGLAGWFESAAADIANYINHQYLILYESRNPPPRGQWRQLLVAVSEIHGRVRFRSGFVR